ncbi:MAG: hypothetical protein V4635_11075 [Bacteroidota bacterium]
MKKILILTMIVAITVSCKKKKDEEPEVPAPVVYTISVKVDGTEKHCNSCYSGSNSSGLRGSYFYLSGFDEEIYMGCSALPAVGQHNLVKYGNPSLIYIKDNVYFRAVNGTLNITAIDTSQGGVINKLTATFNFKTDTASNGVSHQITEGTINLKN